MRHDTMKVRWLALFGFASALLSAVGCSGGGGVGPSPPVLACRDGGTAGENAVTMLCGGPSDSSTEVIDIVMGGPSAGNTKVRGFNFDVAYDPARLEYVPATTATSPLFDPSALVLVVLSDAQPGRLVVSIQQVAAVPDVQVAAGQHTILSLSFRRLSGVTFGPTPVNFERAEATAASSIIGFASNLALSYE